MITNRMSSFSRLPHKVGIAFYDLSDHGESCWCLMLPKGMLKNEFYICLFVRCLRNVRNYWRMASKASATAGEKRWLKVIGTLGEFQSRLLVAERVLELGWGGVSHLAKLTGISRWNKIEHRLFSFIRMNWKGRPLVSYETVVNLIGSTRPRSRLKVKALLDMRDYAKGQQVSEQEMKQLNLKGISFHPDWNYTLSPASAT